MQELASRLRALAPEVLVMISPHSPMYRDAFAIKGSPHLQGSFASFACPQVRIAKENDLALVRAMLEEAEKAEVPLVEVESASSRWSMPGEELDHGLLVPLYFFDQAFEARIVCLSLSGLSYRDHFRLGRMARDACTRLGRRAVFVASGDLSHRLIPSAPAGYSPRGKEFDKRIVDIAASGLFDALYEVDEGLVEAAGECGFRSIHAMWGALKNGDLENSVLSYEGPFGVGYLVSLHLRKSQEDRNGT